MFNYLEDKIRKLILDYGWEEYYRRKPWELHVHDLIQCPRRSFFELYFGANPIPKDHMIFGRILHNTLLREVIPKALKTKYIEKEVKHEVKLKDQIITIKGRIDAIIEYNNELILLELKTTQAGYIVREHMRAIAYTQACTYTYIWNQHYTPEIKKIWLLITQYPLRIDDKWRIEIYEYSYDPEVAQKAIERGITIINHLINNTIPKDNCPLFEFECKDCPFNIICKYIK